MKVNGLNNKKQVDVKITFKTVDDDSWPAGPSLNVKLLCRVSVSTPVFSDWTVVQYCSH